MAKRRNPNQKYHDRVAGKYERIYSDDYWQWHDSLTWDYLKKYLPTDLSAPVADFGCGSGKWGRRLLKSGYQVTFLDLSIKMLDEARRQLEEINQTAKADFMQADVEDLSAIPRDHYQLITAMGEPICSTHHPDRAVREIARCLKPGGVLVATFDHRLHCIDHFLDRSDLDGLEQFLRKGRTHWLTRDKDEQFEMHAFTPDQIRKMLEVAGLDCLEIVGKTVLPMRHCRMLLEDKSAARRLARIEKSLSKEPWAWGRCAHLQVAARREPA